MTLALHIHLSVAVFPEYLLLVAETKEKLSRFTTGERMSQNIVNWYKSFGFTLIDSFGRISCDLFAKTVTVLREKLFKCGFSSGHFITFYLSRQSREIM